MDIFSSNTVRTATRHCLAFLDTSIHQYFQNRKNIGQTTRLTKRLCSMLIAAALALVVGGCSDEPKKVEQVPDVATDESIGWDQILVNRTQGTISKKDIVFLEFSTDVFDTQQLSNTKLNELFQISPKIEGQISVRSKKEIWFQPNDPLEQGAKYDVVINPELLDPLPELPPLEFSFHVMKQAYELYVDGLAGKSGQEMVLEGRVQTADYAESKSVQALLTATYQAESMAIEWSHDESGRVHTYKVTGIQRDQKEQTIRLSWNGQSLNIEDQGYRDFQVPAIGKFELISVKAIQQPQSLEIRFSENVSEDQPVKDLIRVDRSATFEVENNIVKALFGSEVSGQVNVSIDENLKSTENSKLGKSSSKQVIYLTNKPQVRFISDGVIVPSSDYVTVPFEAVNVKSVQVTAFQVYSDNVRHFLQVNEMKDSSQRNLQLYGRYIWRKTINLTSPIQDSWNRYDLDLTELFKENPGAIFKMSLSINPSNSTYLCSSEDEAFEQYREKPYKNFSEPNVVESSGWDGIESYVNTNSNSVWHERNNPCKTGYYQYSNDVKDDKLVYHTNLGLIAKQNDTGSLLAVTTDLLTGAPKSGVDVRAYNLQNQLLGETKSNSNGFAEFKFNQPPFYLVATDKANITTLKLATNQKISISEFDTGGVSYKKGVKGFIYGERGVWRPGDDISLFLVLEDSQQVLPQNYPIILEFFNPKGQKIDHIVNSESKNGFYRFDLKTTDDSPTGQWRVVAHAGGVKFTKNIMIETVKPNRLKIDLEPKSDALRLDSRGKKLVFDANLKSEWLHGATAENLKYELSVNFSPKNTSFDSHQDYIFEDPARKEFSGRRYTFHKSTLNKAGSDDLMVKLDVPTNAPGYLNASIQTKVFEPTGDFSIANQTIPASPYNQYIGLRMPLGDTARGMLQTDMDHIVNLVVLDADGKPAGTEALEVKLFKLNWKWWWDKSYESYARYSSSYYRQTLDEQEMMAIDGKAQYRLRLNHPEWGRYLIRACVKSSDHCTGSIFYMDWPGWAGENKNRKGLGANVVGLELDKEKYNVGEVAQIQIPYFLKGTALLTVENGAEVISKHWIEASESKPPFTLPVTEEMRPNAYVSISLLQPFAGRENDAALRLMGIERIHVENPDAVLAPVVEIPNEVEPQTEVTVKISEEKGKPMTYSLALVDEGLLGLTSYKTPDIFTHFNMKESLGIRTWDIYDQVVGAYGMELERLLAPGGSDADKDQEALKQKRRFPPVVKVLGPFDLAAGSVQEHSVTIPEYLGSLRVMVVAGRDRAYGRTDANLLVRRPLSALLNLPRSLSVDEEVKVPISVFRTDDTIKEATISLTAAGPLELGQSTFTLNFEEKDELSVLVPIKSLSMPGKATVNMQLSGSKTTSEQSVNIDVRYPEDKIFEVESVEVSANSSKTFETQPIGMFGTNSQVLEVSAVKPLGLTRRLSQLLVYPHGCVEQTVSKAMPQVVLSELVSLTKEEAEVTETHVRAAIEKLRMHQLPNGSFAYWPGILRDHKWASVYVGHFLTIAKEKGYFVPDDMYQAWLTGQASESDLWSGKNDLEQAYRLFVLALANKPNISAMNRLKVTDGMGELSRWLLAASYQMVGQIQVANDLTVGLNPVTEATMDHKTFSSQERNNSLTLMAVSYLSMGDSASRLSDLIADQLASDEWLSTHDLSLSILAESIYHKQATSDLQREFTLNINGDASVVNFDKPIKQVTFDSNLANESMSLAIENQNDYPLYARIVRSGLEKIEPKPKVERGISVSVNYFNEQMEPISIKQLQQGTQVIVQVKVDNRSGKKLNDIAVTHWLPVGWEISNERLASGQEAQVEYQDIRDNTILSYFDLEKHTGKTIEVRATTTFKGKYYLAPVDARAMYDETIQGHSEGQWIQVVE